MARAGDACWFVALGAKFGAGFGTGFGTGFDKGSDTGSDTELAARERAGAAADKWIDSRGDRCGGGRRASEAGRANHAITSRCSTAETAHMASSRR